MYDHRDCNAYGHCKTICPLCCRNPRGCTFGPGISHADIAKCKSEECRHLRPKCPRCCREELCDKTLCSCSDIKDYMRCKQLDYCKPVCPYCCKNPWGGCSGPGTYPSDAEKCNSDDCKHLPHHPYFPPPPPPIPPCPSCCRMGCNFSVCKLCRPGPWPGQK